MLYDFGKVKSAVNVQQAKLVAEQANLIVQFLQEVFLLSADALKHVIILQWFFYC